MAALQHGAACCARPRAGCLPQTRAAAAPSCLSAGPGVAAAPLRLAQAPQRRRSRAARVSVAMASAPEAAALPAVSTRRATARIVAAPPALSLTASRRAQLLALARL
jgi:hypothetical protein